MDIIIEEILNLVKKKMTEQGGYTREAYREYIDETIEYFKEKGKLTDDDNLSFIVERLLNIWPQVEKTLLKNNY